MNSNKYYSTIFGFFTGRYFLSFSLLLLPFLSLANQPWENMPYHSCPSLYVYRMQNKNTISVRFGKVNDRYDLNNQFLGKACTDKTHCANISFNANSTFRFEINNMDINAKTITIYFKEPRSTQCSYNMFVM